MTMATVAVTPMRGGPKVIARTMKALSAPPVHSHTGCLAAAPMPLTLCRTTRSAHERDHDRHDLVVERERLEDPHALAELAHDRRLHRACEPRRESQHDRESIPGGHRPTLSLRRDGTFGPDPARAGRLGFQRILYEKAPPERRSRQPPERLNASTSSRCASWPGPPRTPPGSDVRMSSSPGPAAPLRRRRPEGSPGGLPRQPVGAWKWFGAFKDAHDRLREIGKPTVARIDGICVGGGNERRWCDVAVIVDDAYIGHVGSGTAPSRPAPRHGCRSWSASRAREIVISARRSRRARSGVGLVNRAVPAAS